jgi:hypothetical protein
VNVTRVTWLPRFLLTELAIPLSIYEHALRCFTSSIAGTLGGIVNRIIAERRIAERDRPSVKSLGWMHDIRGDVVIGFVIGMVVYAGGAPDVPFSKIIVASVIGGVSGATYFSKTHEVNEARRQVNRERAKSKKLKKATDLALESPIREEGGNAGTAEPTDS